MKLIKNNTPFVCNVCGQKVPQARGNSRDHCPFCLCSIHVDRSIPGDRESSCQGIMKPIAVKNWKSAQYKLLYSCEICGKNIWNITAEDDDLLAIAKVMHAMNRSLFDKN